MAEDSGQVSVIVVGGAAKGVGKTSLICGVLAALPELHWTVVKVTSHAHRGTPLWEEFTPGQNADTERYLAAGAKRALLAELSEPDWSVSPLRIALQDDVHVLFESNRILAQVRPNVCIGVLGEWDEPVKSSFYPVLETAHALVCGASANAERITMRNDIPLFRLSSFQEISLEMLTWLRARLNPLVR